MSEKIVGLRGMSMAAQTGDVEPEVVARLEALLDQARRGEIVALGAVAIHPGGGIHHLWDCPGPHGHALVAGLSYLQYSLMEARKVNHSDYNSA